MASEKSTALGRAVARTRDAARDHKELGFDALQVEAVKDFGNEVKRLSRKVRAYGLSEANADALALSLAADRVEATAPFTSRQDIAAELWAVITIGTHLRNSLRSQLIDA